MIKSNLPDYLSNIDNLRCLVRYQTAPRVSSETVAEHSFFVASYVLKLNDLYNFNLEKALKMAILHDFSEVHISDVPHPIKEKFPLIASELEQAEFDVNEKYIGKDFAESLEEFNNLSTPEGIIVALADILSVISYSKYEVNLGNSKYMKNVFSNAKSRYIHVVEVAKPYMKEGVTEEQMINYIEEFYDKLV